MSELDGALGLHVIVDLWGCEPSRIDDAELVRRVAHAAAEAAGATLVGELFHHFSPHGVSGALLVAESHLAVHTWPEHGYAAADLLTCGAHVDTEAAVRALVEGLGAGRHAVTVLRRGVGPAPLVEGVSPR